MRRALLYYFLFVVPPVVVLWLVIGWAPLSEVPSAKMPVVVLLTIIGLAGAIFAGFSGFADKGEKK